LSLAAAACTLALVTAGGLVTSNDAALAVPDWLLNWGRLVPPLEGGIRFEFAHRVLALLVAVLTAWLAVSMQAREPRRWMRRLAWWAFAAVVAQALLGGALVKLIDPKVLAIAHALLAEICFGLTVAVAAGYYGVSGAGNWVARLTVAVLFLQAVLGAALRHGAIGVVPHIVVAAIAAGVAMWASLGVMVRHLDEGRMPRPAVALLGLTAVQIFSGIAAYSVRAAAVHDPQPMPLTVWTTVAHVVIGALTLGAAIVLAMTPEGGKSTSR
jgi:cytochrome c oxidase assembly protein subunit 15